MQSVPFTGAFPFRGRDTAFILLSTLDWDLKGTSEEAVAAAASPSSEVKASHLSLLSSAPTPQRWPILRG